MEVTDQRKCWWAWRGAITGRFLAGSLENVLKKDGDKPEDKEGNDILNGSHGSHLTRKSLLANGEYIDVLN